MPAAIDMKVAACLPEAFLTVWYNVIVRAGLKRGETLLVHGGTSGIGNIAVQLAKAMNCRVIATAGSSNKCELLADIGTDICLNYNDAPLTEQCAQHGVLGSVDVVLDMVGGDFEQFNLECLAVDAANCLHRADARRSGHNRPHTAANETRDIDWKHLAAPHTRGKSAMLPRS